MKRLILAIGVLLLLTPVLTFEGLYQYEMHGFAHVHARDASPELLQDALWIAIGEKPGAGVTRLWAGNYFQFPRQPGLRAARHIAFWFLPDDENRVERQVHEAAITVWLSRHTSEAELKRWLPEFTRFDGASGAFAASWLRFHKRVDELTLGEIATIAAMSDGSPRKPEYVKRRREWILNELRDAGRISDQQLEDALAEP